MPDWIPILLLSLAAGASMPLGALLARFESVCPDWLGDSGRHLVIAFGGGALLSAVALVLVPEGSKVNSIPVVILCFGGGGLLFALLNIFLARNKSQAGQLVAMLSDFVPEVLVLGTIVTEAPKEGVLLAFLIVLQNVPEGFNAFRELRSDDGGSSKPLLGKFALLALLGPAAALGGYFFLQDQESLVGGIQLVAAGGILYLVIQDIAPQAQIKDRHLIGLGSVAGFLLGLAGHLLSQ